VLFTNHRGELCEGTWTNVFIQRDGVLLTPPRRAGILPGILREDLLRRGIAREATLFAADIDEAEALWLGNSVRGLLPARPVTVDST
jgi:branched-subunit amino acid aminotransferase/4-amino-4-deoxychorismate lyase